MAYKIDKNKGGYRFQTRSIGLKTQDTNDARNIGAPNHEFYELEAAEVTDVILDEFHPDFITYEDIGKAKVRMIHSERGKSEQILSYAKPINANVKDYPLIGEIVVTAMYFDNLYYTDRLNIFNSVNENSYPGASLPLVTIQHTGKAASSDYDDVSTSESPNIAGDDGIELGDTFEVNNDIKSLKPFEGDIIIEGRVGNSIRFGSNQQTGEPTLKIRNGQPAEPIPVPGASRLLEEDINLDLNSIWMSTDEKIDLIPSTIKSPVHLQFYVDRPKEYLGNQIIMNSDRVVINSRQSEVMVFAKKALNLVTDGIFTVDAIQDIILNTTTSMIINSPRIQLGDVDATEPLVLGQQLVNVLNELVVALNAHASSLSHVSPDPALVTSLSTISTKLTGVLSNQNFTR